jgi:two-component system, chemotaxis family, chemotaxis protein CheY
MANKKILIVDDTQSMRSLLSMTLKQMGFEVVEAVDGVDGLEKLKSNPNVDLIFSDYNMPNKNGIEFIKDVKAIAEFKTIPVVLLTTESEESKKAEGKAAGALAWIVKPFKVDVIQSVVNKIIS